MNIKLLSALSKLNLNVQRINYLIDVLPLKTCVYDFLATSHCNQFKFSINHMRKPIIPPKNIRTKTQSKWEMGHSTLNL